MPNVKTKKFDWQIFLAVFCILLVICCATICCVVGNTDNGVANAYTSEEIGVTNLQFSVNEGFYIKNLSKPEIDKLIDYFTYYYAGVRTPGTTIFIQFQAGYFQMTYNGGTVSDKVSLDFVFGQYSLGDYNIISLQLLLDNNDTEWLVGYSYDYTSDLIIFESAYPFTQVDNDYYFNFDDNPSTSGTFANKLALAVLGSDQAQNVTSIDSLSFTFNNTSNLGCLISPNHNFAIPPIVMPESAYDGIYQEGYDEGYQEGYDEGLLSSDSYNQGYNDGVLVGSQFYKDMTYREDVYRNNESLPYESFERNILDLTAFLTDAFDINKRWYWSTDFSTTSIGGGVLYYPAGTKEQFDNIGDVLTFYKENGNSPIYCIYDAGGSALHKFSDFNYIIDGYDFSILLNDGYALGYQQGINAGNKATEDQLKFYEQRGFEEGKLQGIQIGRQQGYNQGVVDANDYSFFSLFTSVFDAPITAIVGKWGDSDGDGVYQREGGMLNFYIPGLEINFAPFLLSLFTIAIIVLIIRFILARKT